MSVCCCLFVIVIVIIVVAVVVVVAAVIYLGFLCLPTVCVVVLFSYALWIICITKLQFRASAVSEL